MSDSGRNQQRNILRQIQCDYLIAADIVLASFIIIITTTNVARLFSSCTGGPTCHILSICLLRMLVPLHLTHQVRLIYPWRT